MENEIFEYVTVNVTLAAVGTQANNNVAIPDGKVVGIGLVTDIPQDEMINMSVQENGNDVLRPCDLRFSEKTNGGSWINSLRPVFLDGGRNLTVLLTAFKNNRAASITVQVLFAIQKQSIL